MNKIRGIGLDLAKSVSQIPHPVLDLRQEAARLKELLLGVLCERGVKYLLYDYRLLSRPTALQ